ncbi:MAG: xylanase [Ignavibacteria bacterium]|nr:xylanase [Ignavibacteria bacterium]
MKNQFGKNRLVFVALVVTSIFPFLMFYNSGKSRSNSKVITYQLDPDSTFQVVHNFGASDAWAFQFVGKYWPMESRERISKLLFSTENATDGSPLGIGLSAWRFNIGAGSAEQGSQSEISDEWRRAECFLEADGSYNWSRQLGQQWFLQAARRYGVTDFIAFVNSPPVYFTRNAKAWSADGKEANLPSEHYGDYANFLVQVIDGMEQNAGVTFNYISPFNEPQWEWKCCGQEGSPWNNDEIARFTRILNQKLLDVDRTQTKIELSEAGQIDFLFDDQRNPVQRNNQIAEFFDQGSDNYLGNLSLLAPKIAGHSYFSTWDLERLMNSRRDLVTRIRSIDPGLEYWMSEYTLLENNGEIKGTGRDLGIDPALYMARVIQADMLYANASAWHWWLAVSPYDYKDGLIYIDLDKNSGEIYESKMLWALGNFSRFIRPGAVRIAINRIDGATSLESLNGVLASAYRTTFGELVVVLLNQYTESQRLKFSGLTDTGLKIHPYLTSSNPEDNLRYLGAMDSNKIIILPGRSIMTCVFNYQE